LEEIRQNRNSRFTNDDRRVSAFIGRKKGGVRALWIRTSAFICVYLRLIRHTVLYGLRAEAPRNTAYSSVIDGTKRVISHALPRAQVAAGQETRYFGGSMAWS
jgi:hypothetical protein